MILAATEIGRRVPSIAGLIAVMPLTGALVMVWLYLESDGDLQVMRRFASGAVWGILPSVLFFVVAFFSLARGLRLSAALAASFGAWAVGAVVHQLLLREGTWQPCPYLARADALPRAGTALAGRSIGSDDCRAQVRRDASAQRSLAPHPVGWSRTSGRSGGGRWAGDRQR